MSRFKILLVEDDKVDVMAIKRVLKEAGISNSLDVANDGEESLKFLKNSENEKPDIILLDLNMPVMNGIEFLKIVKQEDSLKEIPVVVLTVSREDQDMVDSLNLGVAGYLNKPVDGKDFSDITRLLFEVIPYSVEF